MEFQLCLDDWELNEPFITAKDHLTHIRTLTVHVTDGQFSGRGEALGVDYLGETAETMEQQLQHTLLEFPEEPNKEQLQDWLPAGGARNALDCALWDLRCKREGRRAWDLLEVRVKPVDTLYTLSMDSAQVMAAQASARPEVPAFKLKLDQHETADKIQAIRAARPDAGLVIDANGSWTPELLEQLGVVLHACRIDMVEQPLEMGCDQALEDIRCPVPVCADESCQERTDLPALAARYDMVNIKLDKCGGLTEALLMIDWCRSNGMRMMVGNMLGSSLAMAPGFIVAQHCRWVDLDGPLWQKTDRSSPMDYCGVTLQAPAAALWG